MQNKHELSRIGQDGMPTHHAGSGNIERDGIICGEICDIELLYQDLLRV